jgi:SAM-dependent MidA family methyltransferase
VSTTTPLELELRELIAAEGPISVARFMQLCLTHPRHGYYMGRDPFGRTGDFITAPEISQMFGELLGLWAPAVWDLMGRPDPVLLVELGPGRGTLMADVLRASNVLPGFRAALNVHLVEASPVLRERQRAALAQHDVAITWHDDLTDVPGGRHIVLANEFLDALPVHQAVMTPEGWRERVVGLDAAGDLTFGVQPIAIPQFEDHLPENLRATARTGDVYEWHSGPTLDALFQRLRRSGGAALLIDYGHRASGFGDTLQAVRGHTSVSPLAFPGEADLTAHVDFAALIRQASAEGLHAHGPLQQGEFLRRVGIEARADRLKAVATPEQRDAIEAALSRLAGSRAGEMGALFKVLGVSSPEISTLPGFDS